MITYNQIVSQGTLTKNTGGTRVDWGKFAVLFGLFLVGALVSLGMLLYLSVGFPIPFQKPSTWIILVVYAIAVPLGAFLQFCDMEKGGRFNPIKEALLGLVSPIFTLQLIYAMLLEVCLDFLDLTLELIKATWLTRIGWLAIYLIGGVLGFGLAMREGLTINDQLAFFQGFNAETIFVLVLFVGLFLVGLIEEDLPPLKLLLAIAFFALGMLYEAEIGAWWSLLYAIGLILFMLVLLKSGRFVSWTIKSYLKKIDQAT